MALRTTRKVRFGGSGKYRSSPGAWKSKRVARKKMLLRKMQKRNIRRTVMNMAETKTVGTVVLNQNIYAPAAPGNIDAQIFQVSPCSTFLTVNQGTGQGDRIGNQIRVKNVMLKGTIVANGYNATTNPGPQPCVVTMVLFYDKENPTILPAPYAAGDFFQFANNSTTWRNDLVDLWAPVNSDRYSVFLRRKFKMGFANYAGTGTSAANQSFANNDFKLNHNFSINITKYLRKVVKYRDNNSDPPQRGLYCMMWANASDGSSYGSAICPAHFQFSLDMKFIDL